MEPRRRWALAVVLAVWLAMVAAVLDHVAPWPLFLLLPVAAAAVAWLVHRPSAAVPILADDAGRREIEWYGLLAVEYARTPAERRLALASEFLRLAGDLLRVPPTNRRHWPGGQRLNELRRQANLLLGSAVDPEAPTPLDGDEDAPTAADLQRATTCLARYAGLLAALATGSQWDAEMLRLLTRERTRLDLAREQIAEALAAPRLPTLVEARPWRRELDAAS